jgi:adenosylmethionine-8-amino-7-oxononanoate aminotransferase
MYPKKQTLAVDRKHIWHPYTQMKDYAGRDPLVIVKGKGVKLYDADGNSYYDTISSWWCNVHGHGQPKINRGIQKQLQQLEHVLFAGITHPAAAELVSRLQDFLHPLLCRFFFSDNGSTSVEVALKMAFQYWQNQGNRTKPLRFKSLQARSPNCRSCTHRKTEFTFTAQNPGCQLECFSSMEKILRQEKDRLAAVIVEPLMQGAGGISFYPAQYLKQLRALTSQLNILLIFDEVATGFGRTGSMFAFQQAKVVPDFICLSKGLTAGYLPLALTVTREKIYQAFYSDDTSAKTFFHGHTYTANPLACAAGIENLKLFKQKKLPASQAAVMRHFHGKLRAFKDLDFIGDIRYLGFIGAVDIVRSRKTKTLFAPESRIGFQIYVQALKNGLLLRPLGDTIYWFLPLVVTRKDIDIIMTKSRESLLAAIASADR